ncbi:MAG: hypothetical protein ACK551_00370 [Vampirovibrionales bacterium]
MLTRLSTPSPFPQTPARQTAPAAQRPAAQRQGFTKEKFNLGGQILTGLKDLELDPNMPKAQRKMLSDKLKEEWEDFRTIANQFSRLSSEADYILNRSKVEASLLGSNLRLWAVFRAFQAECPAEGRSSIINAKIAQAERLSQAFEALRFKLFPPETMD